MRLNLLPNQRSALRKALKAAFTQAELNIMLVEEAGRSLVELTALPNTIDTIVFDVIDRAEAQSWTDRLLLGAAAWRPEDPLLGDFLRTLDSSAGSGSRLAVSSGVVAALAAGGAQDALQGIVNTSSKFVDVEKFLARLAGLQAQVCRVEVDGEGIGTGFLVGEDRVLTNHHVRRAFDTGAQSVRCRFDYRVLAGGVAVRAGQEVALAASGWLVAESPAAASDSQVGGAPPTPHQLDYALLKLDEPVATFASGRSEELPDGKPRGYIALPEAPAPAAGADIFVLQHPRAQPLKLAVGRLQAGAPPWRTWHDAPTEPGSSGSPCFDANLRLVALHHATDPADPKAPKFNQAVPIGVIAAELRQQGAL
jgi:hypothetical protein